MFFVWLKFSICVLLVLFFGAKLSRYGDVIAEKTGLSGLWIGLLLLAVFTSLPELITGASAVAVVVVPDLAMGTAFGSNLFNLVIIAILDIMYRPGPLLSRGEAGQRLLGGMSMLLIAFAAVSILIGNKVWGGAIGWVSIYGLVLVLLYLWGSRMIFRFERRKKESCQETESRVLRYENISTSKAYVGFAIAALAIIGSGTWLAMIGDDLVTVTGWGATFVGSLFLAATTSLPELVVSITALRLGAIDMAIADMLGSNIFNMGIVIVGVDLFYRQGSIFSASSTDHAFTAAVAVLMTLIVIAGLVLRPERKTLIGMSWYSLALIGAYVVGTYILFSRGMAT